MEKVMQSFTDEQKGIKEYYLCDVLQYGKRFQSGTWIYFDVVDYNAAAIVTKSMIEDVLKWSEEELLKKLSAKTFKDEKVMQSFTDEQKGIKEYYLCDVLQYGKRFPMGTWIYFDIVDYNAAAIVTKAMIEDVLKWSEEELLKKLSEKTFKDNKLGGMLTRVFANSPYAAINNAYPGKYKPWQFEHVPKSYWTKERAVEATIWLIEEKLKWSEDTLLENLSARIFIKNGLGGMLVGVFDCSPYAAIDNSYPGKYKPWQFANVPLSYWTKETAAEATKWLIEEKLKWSEEDVVKKLSRKTFYDNGLRGMLTQVFANSPYAAINNAYPGKYVKSDFYGYRSKV